MSRKRDRPPLPSPEDVLAGRVRVRAEQLFALVHDVNPTGEESPRERERYVLKSRLQALLLTHFGDEVEVHPDPDNPDLVSLRHRSGLRDACHAIVSQLPVEARALVRRRLDEAEAPDSDVHEVAGVPPQGSRRELASPATFGAEDAADASPGAFLARGREAVEAYDYEEARQLLSRAVERGAGVPAAHALLELLVDLLADDEAALALEARLSPPERSDPGIRGLLALAAARTGEDERSRRLVRSLDGLVAASVHATLARRALDSADSVRAAEHLEAARRADPAELSLDALEHDLGRRREDERRPAEEALLSLHSKGDRDASEAAARDLLHRWPDSPAGRRVIREIEETRRKERSLALEREGHAALESGDPARAVRLLTQVLAGGLASPGVKDLLALARHEIETRAAKESLEAHRRELARVARESALSKAAEERLASARAERAHGALSNAQAQLDKDDLDGAAMAIHELKKGDLDPEGQAQLARLKETLQLRESANRATREARARDVARRALRLAISTEPHSGDELADCDGLASSDRFRPCLTPDGGELVLTDVYDPWLFVRVVDVARNEVVRRLSMKVPHALGTFETTLVEEKRLTVLGDRAGLVEIDLETGELLRSVSLATALPASSVVDHVALVPGGRLAWIEATSGPERASVLFAVDLESGRVRSRHKRGRSPEVVPLGSASLVLLEGDGRIEILNVDGLPAAGTPPVLPIDVHAAAPAPVGPGILVAGPNPALFDPDYEAGADESLYVLEIVPGVRSEIARKVALPGTWGEGHIGLATARREGSCFVVNLVDETSRVFSLGPDLLDLAPQVEAPAETALFADGASNHVVAACWWGERFAAIPLGRTTRWPSWSGSLADRDPLRNARLDDDRRCRTTSRPANAEALALYASLADLPPAALLTQANGILLNAKDGDELEALLGALELGPTWELQRRVDAELQRLFPEHPAATMRGIARAARAGDWSLVIRLARAVPPDRAASLPQHARHLHAVALARLGEIEAALTLFNEIRAENADDGCEVDELIVLLREIVGERPSDSAVGRLVGAVKASIAASAASDARRVIHLLDRGLLWASEILQGHALLAKAWLDLAATTPRDLFRKRRALARLLNLLGKEVRFRHDLPPLPGGLTDLDIEQAAARARTFLDQQGS